MEIKAVIFDFDGTLADTKKAIVVAKQDTMRKFGLDVKDEEACAATIGLTARAGFEKLYPELNDEALLDELVVAYRARFDELKKIMPPERFPGVDHVLAVLEERGIVRTIATARNKKSLFEFLAAWNLEKAFPYVLAGEDTTRLKPHPDAVLKTLSDLSLSADQAIVVGDMPVDIAMGKSAGVRTCGVTYGNSDRADLEAAGADFVIDNIEELLEVLSV
ncbi:MAG: HAD-IA family hydrolase [Clostridiales bacterium]|nr:HAD-IA family hydrolase [Clostridiales bacterium]